ncbi:SpoIID/LytB domain-containing protein [Merismopedia glauca]|uniref:Sporulation protein SpoIID n=1 Tax=Merismopedia glauca CCAP 1448/3 TaxID=1296344 RepID=A0A2T1CAH6_9CYAN|nr:SpoIID/LytB domain-containing protein [Merismopedia glauca]PSB05276.1 sporulation protein SpoIID [Merismopedia glauca CCAP 1448/3]
MKLSTALIWGVPILALASSIPLILARSAPENPPIVTSITPSPTVEPPKTPKIAPQVPKLARQLAEKAIAATHFAVTPTPTTKSNKSKPKKTTKTAKIAPYKPPSVQIRVAVSQKTPSVAIGTSTPARLKTLNGQRVGFLQTMQGVNVQMQPQGLQIGEQIFPGVIWVEPTAGGAVYVGDRWYRGRLLLVAQKEGILAVNAVDLEQYLYSVVGSEMHSQAPIEALKAQSVAARSYAMVHILRPASDWYNLGNTERWQVYKGIKSEYPSTYQAVNETGGQILSDRGRVVESLYASTAEIVNKVHKGWGMSQTGAYQLANQGYNYQQILGNYYPGVQLSRLGAQ